MQAFLEGLIAQQRMRADKLMGMIPRSMAPEFTPLVMITKTHLKEAVDRLQTLDEDLRSDAASVATHAATFREIVQDMHSIETVAISALTRANSDQDLILNRLLLKICASIDYPLVSPIAIPLSAHYFEVYSTYNLIRVPLIEGQFLLHLPDLLHELAHPFFFPENQHDPASRPIITTVEDHLGQVVIPYFAGLTRRERARHPNPRLMITHEAFEASWIRYWDIEFICDMFGIYTLGSAFAWSHIYLVVKRMQGGRPFDVPEYEAVTHPSDDARMRLMLTGLRHLGLNNDADRVERHWRTLMTTLSQRPSGLYLECYPDELLTPLAQNAVSAFERMRITRYTPNRTDIVGLFDEAWQSFWRDPKNYAVWEHERITQLSAQLTS